MKLKLMLLFVAAAALGVTAAMALAKPPPGHGPGQNNGQGQEKSHGNPHDPVTTGVTTGTTTTTLSKKVTVCHRTHSLKNPWVLISISRNALPAHLRQGDHLPLVGGGCVAPLTTTSTTATTIQ